MPIPSGDTGRLAVSGQDEFATRADAGRQGGAPSEPVGPRKLHDAAILRMRRGAHRVFVWLGSIAAALIIVIGFGLWRLVQGPIELDRLTPYVEEAFNRSTDELRIAVSGARFAIDRDTRQLGLQLKRVHL